MSIPTATMVYSPYTVTDSGQGEINDTIKAFLAWHQDHFGVTRVTMYRTEAMSRKDGKQPYARGENGVLRYPTFVLATRGRKTFAGNGISCGYGDESARALHMLLTRRLGITEVTARQIQEAAVLEIEVTLDAGADIWTVDPSTLGARHIA